MVIDKPEAVETVIVNLPFFPGFYESMLSRTLDHAEERQGECDAEKEGSEEYYPETYQPEKLRLSAADYCDIMLDCMDYRGAHEAMAKDYCDAFDSWAAQNIGTPEGSFVFESMDSPREYNFTTDRVYCTVPLSVMEQLRSGIDHSTMAEMIKERHSSRSGFISFYSNDVASWDDKETADFDHNELGTVLSAAMVPHVESNRDFNWTICEGIFETDYEYVDNHCDWKKHESKVTEKRAEKLAAWIKNDPDAAAAHLQRDSAARETLLPLAMDEMDTSEREAWETAFNVYADAHYRCPVTRDLFEESRR